ncbi:unnamed protein product, partial [Didymodactylos carnosus]
GGFVIQRILETHYQPGQEINTLSQSSEEAQLLEVAESDSLHIEKELHVASTGKKTSEEIIHDTGYTDVNIESDVVSSTNVAEAERSEKILTGGLNLKTTLQLNETNVQKILENHEENYLVQIEELSNVSDSKATIDNLCIITDEILRQASKILYHDNQIFDNKSNPDERFQSNLSSSNMLMSDEPRTEINQDLMNRTVEQFNENIRIEEEQLVPVPDNEEERNELHDTVANENLNSQSVTNSEQLLTNKTEVDTIQPKPTSTIPVEENLERGVLSEEDSFHHASSQKSGITVAPSYEIYMESKIEFSAAEEKPKNLPEVPQLLIDDPPEQMTKSESMIPDTIQTENIIRSIISSTQTTEAVVTYQKVEDHEIQETKSGEINFHIISPLKELGQTSEVSTRYTSSDVYYAYLGDHCQINFENETIKGGIIKYVSDDTNGMSNVNELTENQSADEDLKTEFSIPEESTVLQSIAQTAIAPFTNISETMQKVVANLQLDLEPQSISTNVSEELAIFKSHTELEEKSNEKDSKINETENVQSQSEQTQAFLKTIEQRITSPVVTVTEVVQNIVSSIQQSSSDEPGIESELPSNQEDYITLSTPSTESGTYRKADQIEELSKFHASDIDVKSDQLEPIHGAFNLQELNLQLEYIHEILSAPELITSDQDDKFKPDFVIKDSSSCTNESPQLPVPSFNDSSEIQILELQPPVEIIATDVQIQQLQENIAKSPTETNQIHKLVTEESKSTVASEFEVPTAINSPLKFSDIFTTLSDQNKENIEIFSSHLSENIEIIEPKDIYQEKSSHLNLSQNGIEQTSVSEQHKTDDPAIYPSNLDMHTENSNYIEQVKGDEFSHETDEDGEKQIEQPVESFQPFSINLNQSNIVTESDKQTQIQTQELTNIQQLLEEMLDMTNSISLKIKMPQIESSVSTTTEQFVSQENHQLTDKQTIDNSLVVDNEKVLTLLTVISEKTTSVDILPSVSEEEQRDKLNSTIDENLEKLSTVKFNSTDQNNYSRECSPEITEVDTFDLINTLERHNIIFNSDQTNFSGLKTINYSEKIVEVSSTDTSDAKSSQIASRTIDTTMQADSTEKLSETDIKKALSSILYTQTTTVEQCPIEGQKILTESDRSTTTSASQITSSDRYLSYAIHELDNSSVERLDVAISVNADLPVFKSTNSDTSAQADLQVNEQNMSDVVQLPEIKQQQQQLLFKNNHHQQHQQHDVEDATEFDATENITYSLNLDDENLASDRIKKLSKKQHGSSTDEDADEDIMENVDIDEQSLEQQQEHQNIYRIVQEVTNYSPNDAYRRYDTSSRDSSSAPVPTEDVFLIPGFPGLWRGPDDDDSMQREQSSFGNDADDERYSLEESSIRKKTTIKTKTIVRTADPSKFQNLLGQDNELHVPLKSTQNTIQISDVLNRPLNEFEFDPCSESDSFKTALETETSLMSSHPQARLETEQYDIYPTNESFERKSSPFTIRSERGVSLPVPTNISFDDLDIRLSTSSPIETPFYPEINQTNSLLLSDTRVNDTNKNRASSADNNALRSNIHESSPYSEIQTTSSGGSSRSLSSSDEQRIFEQPLWWKADNITEDVHEASTTTEPLESKTTVQKCAKGPICISECDNEGRYITIENTSRSKSISLSGWSIRQEAENETRTFTFPENCLLKPNYSLKIYSEVHGKERKNGDLIAMPIPCWQTSSNIVTKLINTDGKDPKINVS